jgi:hypothetical protein
MRYYNSFASGSGLSRLNHLLWVVTRITDITVSYVKKSLRKPIASLKSPPTHWTRHP